MDPKEQLRAIALCGTEKLHGRTSGTDRGALVEFATFAAATYFAVSRAYIRVELENVTTQTTDNAHLCAPNARAVTGYEGDFTAEVIEP